MNVIIYAAGISKRLENQTNNRIKGLINFDGKRLIEYQLRWISRLNIKNIIIVIGLEHQAYIDFIGDRYNGVSVKYVYNPDYNTKGNMLSLWHAREYCLDDTIFTTSDLLCNLNDVNKFINSDFKNKILIDIKNSHLFLDSDPVKVTIKNDIIIKLRKNLSELPCVDGISVGIYKFSKKFMNLLINNIEFKISQGDDDKSLYYAIDDVICSETVTPIFMENHNWIDIDTPEELKTAIKNIKNFN